jgi:hypothetical protein
MLPPECKKYFLRVDGKECAEGANGAKISGIGERNRQEGKDLGIVVLRMLSALQPV